MPGRLQNKIAVITGASSGLGRAMALAYAAEGAQVVCSDLQEQSRSKDESVPTHEAITKSGGKAIFQKCDTTQEDQIQALVKKAVEWGGRLDVMVNNAGISAEARGAVPIWESTLDAWNRTMAVNATGVFLGIKYASKQMLEQEPHSSGDRGWIINLASIFGLVGTAGAPTYVASKHAVAGLTRTAALACGPKRIHVNAICPGYTRSSMTEAVWQDAEVTKQLEQLHPFAERLGDPEDLAKAAIFLASDDARWVNGLMMAVDGGYTAH